MVPFTLFTLVGPGHLRFVGPVAVTHDPPRIAEEAETAWRVLHALNHALVNDPVGPCRQLQVFHYDLAEKTV